MALQSVADRDSGLEVGSQLTRTRITGEGANPASAAMGRRGGGGQQRHKGVRTERVLEGYRVTVGRSLQVNWSAHFSYVRYRGCSSFSGLTQQFPPARRGQS